MAKDDQHAGSSRAVDSVNQSVQRETSTGVASTGERVPTTPTAAGRSYESAVSGAQRPLHPTVRTRSSSAATNKRDLSAQGRRRSSPLAPLLELPAPPRAKARLATARRREYGFRIGRRQSGRVGEISSEPDSEPDPDEQDMELDAWMASVAVESKSTDTPAVTIQVREASDDVPASSVTANGAPRGEQHITMTSMEIESTDNVPGSSVTANGEPRGDPHITMSSSLGVEASADVPVSTTMSTSIATVVEETPSAGQGTNRFNLPPVPAVMTRTDLIRRANQFSIGRLDESRQEIDSLRVQLGKAQLLITQLQSLLEVDQDAHPSNKKAKALQAQLITAESELETARRSLATKEQELDRSNTSP